MRLLLIRHGQTPANVTHTLDTALPGPGLTDLGLQQASALPDVLTEEPLEAVYVSRARRAHLTAAPLAERLGLTPVELPGVHEVQAGEVEGKSDRDSIVIYLKALGQWAHDNLDADVPGGEIGRDFFARYDDSLQQVYDAGHNTAAIVSHGAAIRTWATLRARNLGPGFAMNNPVENTGVIVLEGEPGNWVAHTWMGVPLGGPGIDDQDPFEDAVVEGIPV